MGWSVFLLRQLHSLVLILYASVTWLYAEFFVLKHVFNRYWNGGLNHTDAPFLHMDKPIHDLDHIAFVIYEDDLSIPIICQLILICMNLQIRDISITAKSISNTSVCNLTRSYLAKIDNVDCSVNNLSTGVESLTVHSKDRSSNVNFMNLNTGHCLLSSAAKYLSSSSLSEVTANMIDKTLYCISPISPVALTILFGSPSLVGLLPWHSRKTEIFKWPSHKRLDSSDFINILHLYCGITKRLGR